jgi:FKBP-type peptidyl-prolyl cis-trans isomerase SlyD
MNEIVKNSVVSIRYIMKNSVGEVLEDIMSNEPVSYLQGAAGIQPLLQAQLEGLKEGDQKSVQLPAATGLTNEDFIFEVVVDEVRPASEREIELGHPLKMTTQKCGPGCNC